MAKKIAFIVVLICLCSFTAFADDAPSDASTSVSSGIPAGELEPTLSTETDISANDTPVSDIIAEPTPEPTQAPIVVVLPETAAEPTILEKPFDEYTTTEGLLMFAVVLLLSNLALSAYRNFRL